MEAQVTKRSGRKLPQYLITMAGLLGLLSGGTTMSWTAPALPMLKDPSTSQVLITDEEGSWIGSLSPLGALVGALPAGYLADLMGRKWLLLSFALPLIVSWVMIYFASSVWVLYIARFLSGIGLGAEAAISPLYVTEIGETSIRGSLGSFVEIMIVVGIFYTNVFGSFTSYKTLCIVCGVIPIIFAILFVTAPESPYYLLAKGRTEEARKSLVRLRGPNYDVDAEISEIISSIESRPQRERSFFSVITTWSAIKAGSVCIVLFIVQQLCGINAVTYYTDQIFIIAGSTIDANSAAIIVSAAEVAAAFVAAVVIELSGRKILLMISAFFMGLSIIGLGVCFFLKGAKVHDQDLGYIPIICLVAYVGFFGIGFGTVPWLIPGEILPSEIKGLINGLSVAISWGLAFLITKEFTDLIAAIGADGVFWLFGGISIAGGIFVIFFVFETKGKTFQEIQDILENKV